MLVLKQEVDLMISIRAYGHKCVSVLETAAETVSRVESGRYDPEMKAVTAELEGSAERIKGKLSASYGRAKTRQAYNQFLDSLAALADASFHRANRLIIQTIGDLVDEMGKETAYDSDEVIALTGASYHLTHSPEVGRFVQEASEKRLAKLGDFETPPLRLTTFNQVLGSVRGHTSDRQIIQADLLDIACRQADGRIMRECNEDNRERSMGDEWQEDVRAEAANEAEYQVRAYADQIARNAFEANESLEEFISTVIPDMCRNVCHGKGSGAITSKLRTHIADKVEEVYEAA